MKKLLSLLSILAIAGTSIPTTIAASPYDKLEQNKKEEILNREKRSSNFNDRRKNSNRNRQINFSETTQNNENSQESRNINTSSLTTHTGRTNPNLREGRRNQQHNPQISSQNEENRRRSNSRTNNRNINNLSRVTKNYLNKRNYLKNIRGFLSENSQSFKKLTPIGNYDARRHGNIEGIDAPTSEDNQKVFRVFGINQHTGQKIHYLKPNNATKYLSIDLEGSNEKTITVILNPNNNLYLDGFITGNDENKTYWYFNYKEENKNKIVVKTLNDYNIKNYKSLNFGGDYPTLLNNKKGEPIKSVKINKSLINKSIDNLSDFNGDNPENLKDDLLRTIFITSESMRFFSIQDEVNKILSGNKKINKETGELIEREIEFKDYFENKLTKWNYLSKAYVKTFSFAKRSDVPKGQKTTQVVKPLYRDGIKISEEELNNTKGITMPAKVFGRQNTETIEVDHFAIHDIDDVAILSSGSIGRLLN